MRDTFRKTGQITKYYTLYEIENTYKQINTMMFYNIQF